VAVRNSDLQKKKTVTRRIEDRLWSHAAPPLGSTGIRPSRLNSAERERCSNSHSHDRHSPLRPCLLPRPWAHSPLRSERSDRPLCNPGGRFGHDRDQVDSLAHHSVFVRRPLWTSTACNAPVGRTGTRRRASLPQAPHSEPLAAESYQLRRRSQQVQIDDFLEDSRRLFAQRLRVEISSRWKLDSCSCTGRSKLLANMVATAR
jgi:hypothetical protein